MEFHVFLAVLASAFCHASWNAGLKMKVDPGVAITIVAIAGGLVAVPLLAITGWPARASWPHLTISTILHVGYFKVLAEAYRAGDLGQVYPIARGTAPLLTAMGSLLILAEPVAATGAFGIVLLASGVLLLSVRPGTKLAALEKRAIVFALITAALISTYTLVDGRGARAAGDGHAYAVAFFLCNGAAMGLVGLAQQRREIRDAMSGGWLIPLGGGMLSFISYWVALWAMTMAPIALVAAVRESSVLFASAIGVIVLKEKLIGARIVAALLVVGGLALIRLS